MFGFRYLTFRPPLARAALLAAAIAAAGAAAPAGAQSSVTVNFNSLNATDGTGIVYTNNCYTESGFTFTGTGLGCASPNTFAAFGPDANVPTGPALTLNDPAASYIDITRADNAAFSMASLSLAAFDYSATDVTLVGSIAGGVSVMQACPTLPATAFATTFSTCALTAFTGLSLSSVRIESMNANGEPYVFMDDLVFTTSASTVPEPATVALLAGGLLTVGAAARRRRRA